MQIIGLDFGTSNTVCGVVKDNDIELKKSIPSAIFYHKKEAPRFGADALKAVENVKGTGRLMRGFKSALGAFSLNNKTLVLPYDFVGKPFISDYRTIYLQYMNYMKKTFDLKDDVVGVMGRPVNFQKDPSKNAAAQSALESLYHEIGFKDITFEYEPIAAAYSHEQKISKETLAAVVDIGGGTTDIAIIKLSNKRSHIRDRSDDILATSGTRIGGNDFDTLLAQNYLAPLMGSRTTFGKGDKVGNAVYEKLCSIHTIQQLYQPGDYNWRDKAPGIIHAALLGSNNDIVFKRLKQTYDNLTAYRHMRQVEQGKIDLCMNEDDIKTVEFQFGEIGKAQAEFEKSFFSTDRSDVAKVYAEVSDTISTCIKDAQINPDDVQLTIMTGGGSNIELFQDMAKSFFKNAHTTNEDNLTSVANGLTLKARNIYKTA